MSNLTAPPPKVQARDPLPRGGEIVSVPCPLCDGDVELRVYTDRVWPHGDVVTDVLLGDAPCGHDQHHLVKETDYIEAVQELARRKWERAA